MYSTSNNVRKYFWIAADTGTQFGDASFIRDNLYGGLSYLLNQLDTGPVQGLNLWGGNQIIGWIFGVADLKWLQIIGVATKLLG